MKISKIKSHNRINLVNKIFVTLNWLQFPILKAVRRCNQILEHQKNQKANIVKTLLNKKLRDNMVKGRKDTILNLLVMHYSYKRSRFNYYKQCSQRDIVWSQLTNFSIPIENNINRGRGIENLKYPIIRYLEVNRRINQSKNMKNSENQGVILASILRCINCTRIILK